MTNENLTPQHYNRQNQIIDVLLNENLYLKQVINAYLLKGKGISEDELARLKLIAGSNEENNSTYQPISGNSVDIISTQQMMTGNCQTELSKYQTLSGNFSTDISSYRLAPGNNEMKFSSLQISPDVFALQYDTVLRNLAPLMLTAGKRAVQNTAKMMVQLLHNAATPLHDLRALTGMSGDGMSKRIMAMKKLGLITRVSAPKRYLLTDKAKNLFAEKGK